MDLINTFTIPLPPEKAWTLLLDVHRIAPCVPGSELSEVVDERTFRGRTKIKVGPVTLSFDGTARLVDVDDVARTATLVAQGADAKGRGGAQAEAHFALEPLGDGSQVTVRTQLAMSGAVAQYGRASGLMQEIASQIVSQFAANLSAQLASEKQDLSVRRTERAGTASNVGDVEVPGEASPSKPISSLGLLSAALGALFRRWLSGGAVK